MNPLSSGDGNSLAHHHPRPQRPAQRARRYRYNGSAFVIDVKPGETVSEAITRLRAEQAGTDKPSGQLLKAQVQFVHALQNIEHADSLEAVKRCVTTALSTLANAALALREEP